MATSTPTVSFTVKKSNRLVEARYRFSIWETRVFTKLVSMVRTGDKDFKNYRIYLKDILREFELDSSNASYQEIRDAANTLLQKELSIVEETDQGLTETRTHLIVSATTQLQSSAGNFIELSFHPKIKPHIDQLREKYTTYDVKNILNLPSTYSVRIYEILKRYEWRGECTYELTELKEMIGARDVPPVGKGKKEVRDVYPLYGNLNQKVIKQAQRHLDEYTDISFTYEPIKNGRKVEKIAFTIFPNPRRKKQQAAAPSGSAAAGAAANDPSEETVGRLLEQLEPHVEEAAIRRWLKHYAAADIQYAIDYTFQQIKLGKKIDNVGGYLHTMVTTDTLRKIRKGEEKRLALAADRERKRAEDFARVEEEAALLQQRIKDKLEDTVRGVFDRHPEAKAEVFTATTTRRNSGYREDRTKAENMQDPLFRATFVSLVRKRFAEHFTEVEELEAWAKKLRGKKSRLKG
jgi:plasmid replication initiation protein